MMGKDVPYNSPVNCCVDLVSVLLRGERVEEQAAVGEGKDEVLVRQHGRPFDLERLDGNRVLAFNAR